MPIAILLSSQLANQLPHPRNELLTWASSDRSTMPLMGSEEWTCLGNRLRGHSLVDA